MKYIFYILIAGFAFIACNNDKTVDSTVSETNTPGEKSSENKQECYTGNSGKDTVLLNLKTDGDKISGTLSYKFFEKDSNHGTVEGSMHGDTLLANYRYNSEGTSSVREVAFLKKGTSLQEGYGEKTEKDGSQKFKSPASLEFGKGFILERSDCN